MPHILLPPVLARRGLVVADIEAWAERQDRTAPRHRLERTVLFVDLMTFAPEFRHVFYLRGGAWAKLFSPLCPPVGTLVINTRSIGPGLFIQHGMSTIAN